MAISKFTHWMKNKSVSAEYLSKIPFKVKSVHTSGPSGTRMRGMAMHPEVTHFVRESWMLVHVGISLFYYLPQERMLSQMTLHNTNTCGLS